MVVLLFVACLSRPGEEYVTQAELEQLVDDRIQSVVSFGTNPGVTAAELEALVDERVQAALDEKAQWSVAPELVGSVEYAYPCNWEILPDVGCTTGVESLANCATPTPVQPAAATAGVLSAKDPNLDGISVGLTNALPGTYLVTATFSGRLSASAGSLDGSVMWQLYETNTSTVLWSSTQEAQINGTTGTVVKAPVTAVGYIEVAAGTTALEFEVRGCPDNVVSLTSAQIQNDGGFEDGGRGPRLDFYYLGGSSSLAR